MDMGCLASLAPPPEVTALDETYGNMNLKH